MKSTSLAVLRISIGLIFLWAFADKAFGFGYATTSNNAWVNGGSPTKGFLSHVDVGPFAGTLRSWAGAAWADWLFMIGLLGIGLAVTVGIGLWISAFTGTVMMALMWVAEWPPARTTITGEPSLSTNPVIDYHFVYAVVLIAVAATAAGNHLGLGGRWSRLSFVEHNRWLR
ncbi:DoxX family membrane protein [Amycolatopsis oliviviridis]|uniref:DoxX family protein n=1 Tax=Amycolatopsis oliviviridis TaxID=1471590 RepID=A0ABQ3L7E9_9PSEU|nr:hypothetical protein [Amycolatopsis oliviviridis]GHH04727.1 hypothetical protein GCM10017790_07910 [Amycolatopsis oliviviridis]